MIDRYAEANKALKIKPALGQPCNNCGWCCLCETCPVGIELTPPDAKVCAMLVPKDGKFYCKLAIVPQMRDIMAIGQGCDAISIEEKLEALGL